MIVAGVMSGTSADGINVALAELTGSRPKLKLLGHLEFPFPAAVRRAILAAMNAEQARVADLARLNFLLGHLYTGAVAAAARKFKVKVELIGCHGQTLYHQGEPQPFLGRKLAVTWQTGEAAVMAERLGAPVVSDFRPADLAAGGKGAPLVPFLDYLLYRDRRLGRIVQNIGGIANLTAIPPAAPPGQLVAFDTGPGNMVIDAVTERLFGRPFDRDGRIAARGHVLKRALDEILRRSFFRRPPPKTAGREEFGREFVGEFIRLCGRARKEDVVATATGLTARSIAGSIGRFLQGSYAELIVSGGGAENPTLLRMLQLEVGALGLRIRRSDEFGLPAAAKEAVAFAVLAYQTWHRRPGNIPSATGASRPAILGKISYA
ncbi:MAG TPA: anhydro-N-acetylmuramic acid kinase [Terriglobales bacterium]|nr:anhydro-N-acetylmuramic acid kinase [Terriglobales bacterium]